MSMSLAIGNRCSDYSSLIQGIRHLAEWAKPGLKDEFRNYRGWAESRSVRERMALVNKISEKISSGELVPACLLVVAVGEAHGVIVEQAVSRYLKAAPCDVSDEFGAVRDIIEVMQSTEVENRGAVVAALVGQGDRRINGLMRIVRRTLSVEETRHFSRCVPSVTQASHVEFCLEWLIQAYHEQAPRAVITSLTCALMLVVIKNESGEVEDAEPGVGFTVPGSRVVQGKEVLAAEVVAQLQALKNGHSVDYEIDKVIHIWQGASEPANRAA